MRMTFQTSQELCIVIAGGSGFIGQDLQKQIRLRFPQAQLVILSRRDRLNPCDLFSAESVEKCLPSRVDVAFYLVHSMSATASLDQGSFADYDLLMADNFAKAIAKRGVRQLIYLGGLIPEGSSSLSSHLQSRLEMERVFQERGLPTTFFRAGLVVGPQGSSFQILKKLIARLPVLVCPRWTQTRSSPVSLKTVTWALTQSILESNHIGAVYDLTDCRSLSYLEMMTETAKFLGKKRFFLSVPFLSPHLSKLWVRLVTGSPKGLVYPLIESLTMPMVAREEFSFPGVSAERSFKEVLGEMPSETKAAPSAPSPSKGNEGTNLPTVRSVQRFALFHAMSGEELRDSYLSWINSTLRPLLAVHKEGPMVSFNLRGLDWPMLKFIESKISSDEDRCVLLIRGGLLARTSGQQGRLEFRVFFDRKTGVVAIHDFTPALPWYVYRFTQALIHLVIMKAFGRHLKNGSFT